jgi:hypothetical protein
LALLRPALGLPAVAALAALSALGVIDASRARPPGRARRGAVRFRLGVALLHLLQPLARTWGRARHVSFARRQGGRLPPLTRSARRVSGGALLLSDDGRPRPELAAAIANALRRAGLRVTAPTGWEGHDGRVRGSALVAGELVTSHHPDMAVQVRIRPRLRWRVATAIASALGLASLVSPPAVPVLVAVAAFDIGRGWWRVGPKARRVILAAAADARP